MSLGVRWIECGTVVISVASTSPNPVTPTRHRYSGSTSWRAVIPDTTFDGHLVEVLAPGTEFGALRISDSEIYWYGYFRHPEGASFDDESAAARDRFSAWSPQVRAIVAAATADRLMRHDVYRLAGGLPGYIRGRVVMTGRSRDAAHHGPGSIERPRGRRLHGRLIAAPVAAGSDLAAALAVFDQARRPRRRQMARMAAVVAKLGAVLGGGWRQNQPARPY